MICAILRMGSTLSLRVYYDQPQVRGGERLTGRVCLRVHSDDTVHATELRLRFHGRENVMVRVREHSNDHSGRNKSTHAHTVEYSSTHDVSSFETVLSRFDSRAFLRKGDYVFPFAFDMPVGSPSSFSYEFPNGSRCSLRYTCSAAMTQPGAMWGTSQSVSDEAEIVVQGPHHPVDESPYVLGPRLDPVFFCCCWKTGSVFSGVSVNTATASNGDTLRLTVALENHSKSTIVAVEVVLSEHISCHALNHSTDKVVQKFHLRLSPDQLAGRASIQVAPKEGSAGSLDYAQEQEVLARLAASLRAKEPHQVESAGGIGVPVAQCSSDYTGQNVTIRHSLEVRVVTPACVSTPSHSASVYIQAPPPLPAGLPGSSLPQHVAAFWVAAEVAVAQPSAPPADWSPQVVESLPIASPVVLSGYTVSNKY